MGWVSADTKAILVKNHKDGKYYAPTLANAKAKKYPLSRPLHMYTNEKYSERTNKFLDFVMNKEGEKIVLDLGFIPVK